MVPETVSVTLKLESRTIQPAAPTHPSETTDAV
jgi:hypothetical protein